VRKQLPSERATPVRLYLDPIEDDDGGQLDFWETPSHQTLKGATFDGDAAFVYVSANRDRASPLELATAMRGGTLRHELTHVFAARAGLELAPWFEEGLAQEVESMLASEGELHANPFPWSLQLARKSALPGTLAALLAWRRTDDLSAVERSQRYVWAQALLRYLLEQRTEESLDARARAVKGLDVKQIATEEPNWLAWLAGLDALARIRAGAHSPIESERAIAVGEMPSLAASGAAELLTRAADELAIEMVVDPACTSPAATFLLYFRARELTPDDVERMSRSTDPAAILTVEALHATREEPVDAQRVRSAWQRIAENDRARFAVLEALLSNVLGECARRG